MLTDSQKDRLRDLFAEGAELEKEERATFVQRSCADDPVVQHELAELLDVVQSRLEGFLTRPVTAVPMGIGAELPGDPTDGDVPRSHQPPRIEGYTAFEHIAEGGMGTVYRAQQLHPVRRTVAIKVIRLGMDSDAVLERFAAERQALAMMSHPYIAAVHDAGTDAMGRPFIAMEFADGEAITDFCDRERLSLTERLQLFVKVCHAVDHAHRRGVLHRDLKPSNVLVCRNGDQLHPKVIDFGIAKAIEGSLGEHSLHTRQGSFLGTPEYMSPEQLDGAVYSVDTRSDVYSLGVMLYELVTKSRPIDPDRLQQVGLVQLTRIIRDEVPPKPSTRLRELLGCEAGQAPQFVDGTRWLRRLQGDLDWIVMKALEKEPNRRYGSPHELLADIECYLTHLPVAAGPPSGLYRLRKFTRRYRAQVIAAVLVVLSLVVGLFGTFWFLLESQANERAAEQRAREAIAAGREAEGSRIAAQAAVVAQDDPNLALLLALEARRLTDSHTVDQTVLDLLHNQDLVGRFDHYSHDVRQVLFLPDGRLLSRPYDSVVLLTDPDRGTVLRRFVGHADVVTQMVLSPSADRLLTTCDDGTARVWDVETGACVHAFADHRGTAFEGAFSPDGRLLATAGADHAVRVYEVSSGTLLHVLGEHGAAVTSVCFDPSGRRLASQSRDDTTRIWDTTTGALQLLLPATGQVARDNDEPMVRFAARGDRILRLRGDSERHFGMQIYTDAGELLGEIADAELFDGPVTDPLRIRIAGGVGRLSLQTGQLLERQPIAPVVRVLATRPDGLFAIAVDDQEDLCIVDLDAARITRKLSGRSDKRWTYLDVAFHPDGRRFVVTGSMVRMWTWTPEYAPFDLPGVRGSTDLVSVAAGAEALALLEDRIDPAPRWSLWSIDQRRLLRHLQPEGVQSLRLSSCGTRLIGTTELAATGEHGPRLRTAVFDIEGRKLHEMTTAGGQYGHGLSPDGRMQMVATDRGRDGTSVSVFDLDSGELRRALTTPAGIIELRCGPAFTLLTASLLSKSRTDVVDVDTGKTVFRVAGPDGSGHYAAAIDPHGRHLLIVLGDLRARVYDLRGPAPAPIAEYAQIVRSNTYKCGFAADGALAWVSCANEVHLFEAETGAAFAVLRLDGRASFVAAADDAGELHTVSSLGRCQRWPLDPVCVAERLALGSLSRRALDLYRIGTQQEREARELQNLRENPTTRNWARLGEHALQRGDLDEAIACYQRCSDLGPLARQDLRRYLRLLELRCRRLATDGGEEEQRVADENGAFEALQQALRCGASANQLRELPSIDAVRALPQFAALLPD